MYSRRTNVDMWRNGNFESNPPWYVAHVWPINVCLCGRRGGSEEDNIWICFSWCAVVAATAQRGQGVGFIFSRYTASPPRGSDRLVPGPSRRQYFQPCCSRWRKNKQFFFFFFWHRRIFLELRLGFLFWWSAWSGGSQKMRHFQNTKYNCFEEQGRKKKPCNRHVQVSSESQQSRCILPSWRGRLAGYLAFNQCFCIIKLVPSR